ncbi:MAG: hypothetical protein ACYDA9_06245 [Terriglobia bacterium]
MKFIKLLVLVFVFAATLGLRARAGEEQHHHEAGKPEQLGQVHFPVSCNAAAQKQFERAVAMLHSFWYEESTKEFTGVVQTDPNCAMGYWGIAMSQWYPLWYPPDAAHFAAGKAAVAKAGALGAKTDRERDYIAAIETFYKDPDHLDHRARTLAYEQAMEQVHLRYPEDREAVAFYSLSLLASAMVLPPDKTYARQKKAGAMLEKLFTEQPRHPGAAHYIIHSFDFPALASLALPAARNYAKIAPSTPHALHMPSHIFTRLGLWDESIESNLASAAASKEYAAAMHLDGAWQGQFHAMDYLEYAYLQSGRVLDAKRVAEEIKAIHKPASEDIIVAYAWAAVPARSLIERGRWSEARTLEAYPSGFPWNRFPIAEAITHFSRALGAARSGDPGGARQEAEALASLHDGLVRDKDEYWAGQVEVLRREAAAWTAYAEGKNDEAVTLMRAAADLEDSTEKDPVTPGPIVPARELLGDLLLELHQPAPALAEFEASLHASPNRLGGLVGAARAAKLSGDQTKASDYYAKLVALCAHADPNKAELKEARVFLAKSQK